MRPYWQLKPLPRREFKRRRLGMEEPTGTVKRPFLQTPRPKLRNCNHHDRVPFPIPEKYRKMLYHARLPPMRPLLYVALAHRSLLDKWEQVGATREGRPVQREGKYLLHRTFHPFQNPSLLLPLDVSQNSLKGSLLHRSRILDPNLASVLLCRLLNINRHRILHSWLLPRK